MLPGQEGKQTGSRVFRIDDREPFEEGNRQETAVGTDKVVDVPLSPEIQSDGELKGVKSAETQSRSMAEEKSFCHLEVGGQHPHRPQQSSGNVRLEPSSEKHEVRCRDGAGSHLAREDREQFDRPEPGDEMTGTRLRQEGIDAGRADFQVVMFGHGTRIEKVAGHANARPVRP